MNASSLLVPSPFGRQFLRAPPFWLQETLRHHGFGPHQSDGHVLLHTCLRPSVPEDELVLEDHPDFVDVGSKITWTTTFGYILNTALTRMGGGDPAAGDHMEVHLQMLELLAKVRSGPDPTAYSERQLRWEIVDRERWLNSFIPAPITDLKLVKWRHWKPSRIKELGPINQKVLEGHLRRKWAERLLAHLIPHAGEIAHLAPLRGDNEEQEFHDLLQDTRFRTLRQRCLVLEQMLKWNLPIPWKESNVRELLNRLRAQEVTPHKLQLCWDTLRWFAKKFGLLAIQEEHRLLQKKQTVETGLTPAVVQPARKAKVPPKEVIWALEEGAAGVPLLPGAHSPQEKGAYAPRELDTFILGIVRYQVGCSARFNDLQHTAPSTLKHTTTTLEFSAWQTVLLLLGCCLSVSSVGLFSWLADIYVYLYDMYLYHIWQFTWTCLLKLLRRKSNMVISLFGLFLNLLTRIFSSEADQAVSAIHTGIFSQGHHSRRSEKPRSFHGVSFPFRCR